MMLGKRSLNCNPNGHQSGFSVCLQFLSLTFALIILSPAEVGYTQDLRNTQALKRETSATTPPTSKGHASRRDKRHHNKYDIDAIGSRNVDSGLNFYSREAEEKLGEHMARAFERELQFLDDQKATEYIDHLARYLARNSDATFPFNVKLFASGEVNAFSLPGGHLYVSTALILAAENEAQLAGAIAHEIAHIAARHGTKQVSRSKLYSVLSIPAVLLGGPAGYALQAAGYTRFFVLGKFNRNAEQEADTLGLEYGYASGYDPQEYLALLEKLLSRQDRHKWMRLFASHPSTASRIKNAQLAIHQYLPDRTDYVVTTSDFDQVKFSLEQMVQRGALPAPGEPMPDLRKPPASTTELER